jgi:hypothetical protein
VRTRTSEVPEHYERLPLRTGMRVVLWCAAVILVAGALAVGTLSERSTVQTAIGALLAVFAAVAVVAAYRLAAFEVTVTRASLKAGFGPFAVAAPLWGARVGSTRPASSWRRFYAGEELPVDLDDPQGARTLVLPSSAADDLAIVLRKLQPHLDPPGG